MSTSRRVTMATLNARRRRSQEKALIGVFELADGYELSVWRSPMALDPEPPAVRVTWSETGSALVSVEALLLVAPELRHYRRGELRAVFRAAMNACCEDIHGVRLKLFRKLLDGDPR